MRRPELLGGGDDQAAVPFRVLVFFNVGMALSILPLFGQVPLWVLALFGASTATRTALGWQGRKTPSLWLKLAILAAGIGGIFVEFGGFTGMEGGLSVLVVLIGLKFLEVRRMRDVRVLALLGYFLLLCDLFFAQDLSRWLYVGGTMVVLTVGLAFSQLQEAERPIRTAFGAGSRLILQGLPVLLLLFLFFPRVYGGFRFQFGRTTQAGTGMSDEMRPGTFASLAMRPDIAFRADFPDGNPPPQSEMYWRGVVLWRGDGLTWVRGTNLSSERDRRGNSLGGNRIRQRIVLQPHGGRWLFALDRPASVPGRSSMQPGRFLQSERPIFYPSPYEVISRPQNRETQLPFDQREQALSLPSNLSPKVLELAASFKREATNETQVVQAALRYFRENGFVYSLSPGTYDVNGLDEFLFRRRIGFCEHYSGAFATLMRAAGVPSRVVIGYHGGQVNTRHGQYVIVRQSDAHAWCEIWVQGKGWDRVDATAVIAPERISAGFETYLEGQTGDGGADAQQARSSLGWRGTVREARLLWDSLAYRWDLWVLNFDEENQRSFLMSLGMGAWDWNSLVLLLASSLAAIIGLVAAWLKFTGRAPREPAVVWYDRFCRWAAAFGVRREAWEGPSQFTEKAARHIPTRAEDIRQAGESYIRARYGAAPAASAVQELASAVRKLRRNAPPSSRE